MAYLYIYVNNMHHKTISLIFTCWNTRSFFGYSYTFEYISFDNINISRNDNDKR